MRMPACDPCVAVCLRLRMQGGSGQAYDWSNVRIPLELSQSGWLLAGGLHPGNVAEAVAVANPTAVDVSSGVCGPDGLLKDKAKVQAFVAAAKAATTQ
jgi:phosphoribosylanthranilate isomerase